MKIVLNRCRGRFELSKAGLERMIELKTKSAGYKNIYCYEFIFDENDGKTHVLISPFNISNVKELFLLTNETFDNVTKLNYDDFKRLSSYLMKSDIRNYRYDKDLITVVEELGALASTDLSNLKVVEIPDSCWVLIDVYNGFEQLFYSKSKINRI
ncbi:hypothetical protein [Enterococcus cecorum]|uniref:hypothetical protein n=1 Tax=Enterococcus cecorum TaxID=44008 RepID=UPI00148CC5ED|nr:hypothetical protein [Enterococcus cecorum]